MIRRVITVSRVVLVWALAFPACSSGEMADIGTNPGLDGSVADDGGLGSGGGGGGNGGNGGNGGINGSAGPDSGNGTVPQDGSVGSGGTGESGAGGQCRLIGDSCATDNECCTGSCDAQHKICAQSVGGSCVAAGGRCAIPQDCCTMVCSGGTCGASQCTSDQQACTSSSQCCSGNCSAGLCAPLNTSCRTSGNACTTGADCCSKLCQKGVCAVAVSFCTQIGDVCASDLECCGGMCNKASGATVGVCGQPGAPGTTGCTVAGQACGGGLKGDAAATSADGSVPTCGGDCCSRSCAPYKSGVFICQPPSGCRPTGEICRDDADCCGFGGVKGVTGTGACSKANPTDPVGRCDNGNACRPAGAICKLATMSCNAENDCCAGNVNQNPFVCQQDILGIPRCTMLGQDCADAGSKAGLACATSADCCGLPCTPNPQYQAGGSQPAFVCGAVCVGQGGACTTGADCCPGLPCYTPPGSARGTCGISNTPQGDGGPGAGGSSTTNPPGSDAATPDGAASSGTGGSASGTGGSASGTGGSSVGGNNAAGGNSPVVCAEWGQMCSTSTDCCNGVPCTGGRCLIIPIQ